MKSLLYLLGLILLIFVGMHHIMPREQEPLQMDLWSAYKLEFSKYYSPEEDMFRREIYTQKVLSINYENEMGHEYELGINQFSDWTDAEFEQRMLSLLPVQKNSVEKNSQTENDIDWRDKGAVSNVKDQGFCGSCWAFSAVANLEGVNFLFNGGKMELFSEQQLVDCSWDYGNMGCNGGLMTYAFEYVIDHGITTEAKYPYKGVDQKCQIDGGDFKVKAYKEVDSGDCDQQKDWIMKQPVSVAADASKWSSYRSGIFSGCGKSLNHGITAVGFTNDYWIIKNSWGVSWGEKGYMRLKMGNTCGICDMSSTSEL